MQNKGILFYIKSYKFNSMFIKNFIVVFLLFVIPFIGTAIFYYYNTKSTLDNEIVLENTAQARNIRNLSDTILKQADYISANILNTDDVQMLMVNDWYNDIFGGGELNLKGLITTVPLIYDNIDSIYIYSELNNAVITNTGASTLENHQDKGWITVYNEIRENKTQMFPRSRNNIFPHYITIIRPVIMDGQKKGGIVININTRKILEMYQSDKYGKENSIFIINHDGVVLAGNNNKYFGMNAADVPVLSEANREENIHSRKISFENTEYISVLEPSENYNLIYVSIMPMNMFEDKLNYIIMVVGFSITSLFLVSFMVAYFIAVKSFSPIREIISVLEKPEKFNDELDGIRTGNLNELKYIIGSILQTIQLNEQMKNQLKDRLELLDKSHFAMLQTQINPHFLYNTLETINWMAVEQSNNSDNPVSNALSMLGEFFRISTQSSTYFISLKEEIGQAMLYIDILMLRYEDMFKVYWQIDDSILDVNVIKISLQPFIENAVYHGIKPKGKGKIWIKGWVDRDEINLVVKDNGAGMSEEQLEVFNKNLGENFKESDKHLGVYNVYRRYKIVFGDKFRFKISSKHGQGTTIALSFPKANM